MKVHTGQTNETLLFDRQLFLGQVITHLGEYWVLDNLHGHSATLFGSQNVRQQIQSLLSHLTLLTLDHYQQFVKHIETHQHFYLAILLRELGHYVQTGVHVGVQLLTVVLDHVEDGVDYFVVPEDEQRIVLRHLTDGIEHILLPTQVFDDDILLQTLDTLTLGVFRESGGLLEGVLDELTDVSEQATVSDVLDVLEDAVVILDQRDDREEVVVEVVGLYQQELE